MKLWHGSESTVLPNKMTEAEKSMGMMDRDMFRSVWQGLGLKESGGSVIEDRFFDVL